MSYFIFSKDLDNIEGTLLKIAENQFDLDNLNLMKSDYKILEDSQENFINVKFGKKYPSKYNENVISFIETTTTFVDKNQLKLRIENNKITIKNYLNNNPNHSLFNLWNNYYTQLNNLNLDSIVYPLNKSLEQYFNDLGQPSLNILQLP